jgi:hypothetical protein
MQRSWKHLFVACGVVLGMIAGLAAFTMSPASARQTAGLSPGVLIQQTGVIGTYGLPEPTNFAPVSCVVNGSNISITQSNLMAVGAKPQFAIQKVDVQNQLYQRRSDGAYALVTTMGGGSVLAVNHELTAVPGTATTFTRPIGPDYVYAYTINYYKPDMTTVEGTATVAYSTVCGAGVNPPQPTPQPTTPPQPTPTPTPLPSPTPQPQPQPQPRATISPATGTVNTTVRYTISGFPANAQVPITFDGVGISSVTTDGTGAGSGSFKIPAAPKGPRAIRWKQGTTDVTQTLTIKSRIKVVPNQNVTRGQTVNVSLTGFNAQESVRIRWTNGWFFSRVATGCPGSRRMSRTPSAATAIWAGPRRQTPSPYLTDLRHRTHLPIAPGGRGKSARLPLPERFVRHAWVRVWSPPVRLQPLLQLDLVANRDAVRAGRGD